MPVGTATLQIIAATGRPSVATFFEQIAVRHPRGIAVTALGLATEAVGGSDAGVAAASVAVVDASVDLPAALDVCRELRTRRANLPIAALFCCAHSATAEHVRGLLDAGVGSFLDLQLSAEQVVAALREVTRGQAVMRLQLTLQSQAALFAASEPQDQPDRLSDDDLKLLRLVALGLTDTEIGGQFCLSHHTIKHRIERLRRRVNARNRIHLAALAGRLEAQQGRGRFRRSFT